ncbi:MAG: hypothetical protein QW056_04850 [Candidatus Bathyarchaeia archaeon]
MKHSISSALILLLALALRLYPTLSSGMPFSTDGWGPIRNAEGIIAYSPVDLSNETVFDGYHNYWPAVSLFGAFLTHVTGLEPVSAMSTGIPTVSALTVLIFYTLVKRLSGNSGLALVSALLLAVIYPHSMFTAGVTKETYATPIYLTVMLLFLGYGKIRETLLFTIASIALVMAHHLTALAAAAVLFTIAAGLAASNFKTGRSIEKSNFTPAMVLAVAAGLYLEFYAYKGLIARITLTPSDVFSALSYQVVAFAAALYLILRKPKPSRFKSALKCIAIPLTVLFIVLLCTRRAIIPGAPTLPAHYLAYAAPFIAAAPLTVLGAGEIMKSRNSKCLIPAFWISTLLGLEGYAIFGAPPLGLSLMYRILNLITVPLAILCAAGIYRIASGGSSRGLWKIAASALLIFIAASNIYNVYASVALKERYMGYFWTYTQQEFSAAKWLSKNANQTVAGDVKVYYMLREYFSLKVDAAQALKYLYGETSSPPSLLVIYDLMADNGFVIYGGYSVDLPGGWAEKTVCLSQIYSNSFVKIYMG